MTSPITPAILKQVKSIAIRTRGLVDALLGGEYRSVFRGQGMEFLEVRPYEPGDDYRVIDWNVSARLGEPHVKTFTEERELTLFLVVDHSGSTDVGAPVTKVARAVEIAAVLALAAVRRQDRVGALLFTDRIEHVVPPAKGRRHALRVIRDLLAFTPVGRRTDLAAGLDYTARLLHHRSIVVVLSDFVAEGWERSLARLAARHDVLAITIDDPREVAPTASGWITFCDPEGEGEQLVDLGDAKVRAAWRHQVAGVVEARARAFRVSGVDHLALDTTGDYATALRRAFARRPHRRGKVAR